MIAGVIAIATAVFATSAFSTTTLDRGGQVDVVSDEAGLLALIDGHDDTGLVENTSDGGLEIDLTRGGAAGANVDATFTLGDDSQSAVVDDHAFRIVNQGVTTQDVTVEYTLDSQGADDATNSLIIKLYHDAGGDGSIDTTYSITENSGGNTTTVTSVDSGDAIYVAIVVDTTALSSTADLSGTLRVTTDPT